MLNITCAGNLGAVEYQEIVNVGSNAPTVECVVQMSVWSLGRYTVLLVLSQYLKCNFTHSFESNSADCIILKKVGKGVGGAAERRGEGQGGQGDINS